MNTFVTQGLQNAKALFRSRFVRDGSVLAAGAAIAQAVTLLTAPIMSRLYDPAAYGLLALVIAVFSIIRLPASLQYEQAVILPKENVDALAITKGGLLLSIGCLIAILLASALPLKAWLAHHESAQVIDLLPLMGLLVLPISMTSFWAAWLTRKQAYPALSASRLFGTLASTAVAMAIGFFWHSEWGLLVGYVAGSAVTLGIVLWSVSRTGGMVFLRVPRKAAIEQLRRYHRFPLYSMPNQLANQFVRSAPIFLLTSLAGAVPVGLFSMANRLLEAPTGLFVNALAEVFVQRASKQLAETGECRTLYTRTFWALLALGLPAALILTIFAPDILALLLGERWREAGDYSRVLCWLCLFRAVCGPLSTVFIAAQRQAEDLALQLGGLVVTMAAMFAAYSVNPAPLSILAGYVFGYCSMYAVYLVRGYVIARGAPTAVQPLAVDDRPPSND